MSKESLKEREAQIREQYKDVPPAKMIGMIAGQGYKDAMAAKEAGEPVGWCASNFPQEILETLDIKVVYPENHAAAVSAKGGGERMCNVAEDSGYSNDICAYARISMAYTEETDIPELNMPQPDFVACCNNICNCMIKWYENLARDLNVPFIMIDVPYNNEYDAGQDRVDYLKGQFDVAIKQLEEISGKKWDQDKFEEVMEISDRTGRAWLDATSYSKYTPSPFSGFDIFNHMAVAVCARGKLESAIAFERLAEEFDEKVKRGESGFKGEEKYRIIFEGIACWPHLRHTYKGLQGQGVNVVGTVYADAFGYVYNNTRELMEAYCATPNAISYARALDMRLKLAENNNVDGMLVHINRSCKQWSAISYEMERDFREKTGLPTATFDGDQADPRNFSEAQYDTRVQGLIEVMEANKQKKSKEA